jgi:type IV secretion system protein TrbB
VHAGSAHGALTRLEQLVQEVSVTVPRALIAEAVNVIVFIAGRGRARRVREIVRVIGYDSHGYQLDAELSSFPPLPASNPSSTGDPS